MRDGLGQSQVYDILQDSRGLIWMGTGGGGISVFDSREMRTFDGANGLNDPFIKSITELPDQRLFLGGSRHSAFYNGLRFSHAPLLEGKEVIDSHVIGSDLYVVCTEGVYLFGKGKWQVLDEGLELSASTIHKNELYVVGSNGLQKWVNDSWESVLERFPFSAALVNHIRFDEADTLWFSTYGYGVQTWDGNRFRKDRIVDSNVVFHTEEIDGKTWYCTLNEGVLVWDERRLISYSMSNGMPSNTAISCEQDQWGNIWIGTSGGGVEKLSRQAFSHIDRERGLPANQVYSIACDGEKVFMGIGENGMYVHNKSDGTFIQDSLINNDKVKSIHKSGSTLYVGTEGNGLFIIRPDTTYRIGRGEGISGNWIRAITEDKRGNIFVGTAGGGITQLVPGKSVKSRLQTRIYTAGTGLAEDRITDLAVDSLNRIWYSTLSEGVGVIMGDRSIINFNETQGLPSSEVKSLAIDQHQRLWIGLANEGLCSMDLRADTIRIEAFDNKLLSSKTMYFLQPDNENQLWIGTEKGVDVLRMTVDGDIQNIEHYSDGDGYEGIEACTNASCMDANGSLWFGTVEGVSYHQPKKEVVQTSPPNLNITNVNLFYQSLRDLPQGIFMTDWGDVRDTLVFTYEQNHVSFDFLGVHQAHPEDVQYQWCLEGQDKDWSPLNDRTTATFSNLAPGRYVFRLRSCVDGDLCVESHPVHLSILRPFWQKTWFQVGGALAIASIVFLVFYIRLRTVKARSKEKSEKIKLERDLIELEQKALRLQMNPHFIFNTLNSIQGLIARKDEKTARLYLSKFSKLMRQVLENSREDLVSLEEEMGALRSFMELEQFTQENHFQFEFISEFDEAHYGVPPLLIQPFVENAIIHGVSSIQNGMIQIRAELVCGDLHIEVEDNGVGREQSEQRRKTHKSTGLEVTKERLALLPDLQDGTSANIQFFDKESGTTVRISLPVIQEW